MIERLKTIDPYDETEIDMDVNSVAGLVYENTPLIQKVNELVDAVNNQQIQLNNHTCRLLDLQNQINEHNQEIDDCAATISKMENVAENGNFAKNAQPDYVTTSYTTDGNTREYYGQNGASIITDQPLPAGYVITIRETEIKGGDNE